MLELLSVSQVISALISAASGTTAAVLAEETLRQPLRVLLVLWHVPQLVLQASSPLQRLLLYAVAVAAAQAAAAVSLASKGKIEYPSSQLQTLLR